jgi:hypothetical protein
MIRITKTYVRPSVDVDRYGVSMECKLYTLNHYENSGILTRSYEESSDGLTIKLIFDWTSEAALAEWDAHPLHITAEAESLEYSRLHNIVETTTRQVI